MFGSEKHVNSKKGGQDGERTQDHDERKQAVSSGEEEGSLGGLEARRRPEVEATASFQLNRRKVLSKGVRCWRMEWAASRGSEELPSQEVSCHPSRGEKI